MSLTKLGFTSIFESYRSENNLNDFEVGRVISEHKERYIVRTGTAELEAEITGNMRFTAQTREDFPAVGDWVALSVFDANLAIIHQIYPRKTLLKRKAVGKFADIQLIAANVDTAFIMQAVTNDFNLNRLERYLTLCYAGKVEPIILLTKSDLLTEEEVTSIIQQIQLREKEIKVLAISNETQEGYTNLYNLLKEAKTYCMLGSSGVGKSTLLNNLLGKAEMNTQSTSESTKKGRHTTTHRELYVLKNGSIFIDNPGMREVGMTDAGGGLEQAFHEIYDYAKECRYTDCTHTHEAGCAVIQAVSNGYLDQALYNNFLKLEREKQHYEADAAAKRKKDKDFGKMVKNMKKDMKRVNDKRAD